MSTNLKTLLLSNIKKVRGCWVWIGTKRNGYGIVRFNNEYRRAHRASYELFIGPIPPNFFVCHKCDNPPCINPRHLFAGTQDDNMKDMALKGTLWGEKHGQAKLTNSSVREIRDLVKKGVSGRILSQRYGVGRTTIYQAARGITWGHVE